MALSVSSAARAFDQSAKTGADVRKFWDADPAGAATWISEIARGSTNAPPALHALAKAAKLNAPVDQLQELVRQAFGADQSLFDSIGQAIATAQAQAAGAAGLGWSAGAPGAAPAPVAAAPVAAVTPPAPGEMPTPANFVGYLQKSEAGVVQFKTQTGTYDVDLSTTDWREEIETAFMRDRRGNPQLLTMKGFPSADGKRIYAQQFAPGANPNFIAARVRVEGDNVFLSRIGYGAGADDKVQVTHPDFVKLLKGDTAQNLANYMPAGMILPGLINTNAEGKKTYDDFPQAFFILGRTMQLNVGSDEHYDYHDLDTGFFKKTGARSPKGMVVPDASKPGGAKWDEKDTTKGSTTDATGPRAFFYARILPHEEKFPETITFPRGLDRKLEITAVSDQGDNGVHSPSASPISQDFGVLGRTVPASAPEHTEAQGTLDPVDD